MQLKYEKRRFISKINTQNKSKYVKTAINDNNIFPPNLKKKNDSQNFQLNNDNILFSEERNVKPKNYMVNLRNPNNQAYKKYSNINLSGSFNSMDKKTVEVPDKSYLRNYYISRQRARPENIKKILNNSAPKINRSNIDLMKTNMYAKEENSDLSKLERQHLNSIKISNNVNKKNINDFDNMFSKNISLLKPSKNNYIDNNRKTRYIRKQIQNLYNDEDDNEEGFFNDFENNPLNFNKSVRYENNSDYNIESYTDRYRYNLEKQNNNNYNDKYINNDINYKNINDYNNNSMKYSYGLNQNSQNRYLNNFQISRGWFSIEDEKKGSIGSRFDGNMNKEKNNNLENIRQYPGNSFYIKGNKNINSLTISDLNNEFENNSYNNKNLINNQQGEEELNENFELKLKEGFSRIKEEKNIIIKENNKLKEKMNIIDYENQMLRENNYKLNEELKNLKREFSYYNKSQRISNNINKNDTGYYNKNELDNLKEENTKIKNEKYSLLSKAKLMEEQNMKLKEEINNLKKENEIKNNQFNLLNKELSKLNEDINEEFKTSKINLEKLNEDFIALGKENKKFKENLELLEEEKEIELSQKQKLQKENQELKLQQDKLNEQIDFLQEENNELENTGNIQEEYDRLYEEYDNFKKTEMDKYNILLEEKNKLSEELNILKNKGDKNYINNLNKKEVVILKDSKGTKNNEINNNEKEENKDVKKLGFLDKIKNAKKSEKEKSKEKKNFNESNNKFH
jgi:hypothetical protein